MREADGMAVVAGLLKARGIPRAGEVWVHGMWTPRKWLACLWARVTGRRLVRMTHGALSPVYLERQGKWRKCLVGGLVERPLFALCDRIAVTGPWEEEWCRAWGLEGPFETVDLKGLFDLAVAGRGDAAPRPGDGVLRVLYLGRRHPLKGVGLLERAVAEVNAAAGAARVELRVASDHFGAALERDWAWCDVLCLPTLSENFGLVVAEALARGRFAITTDGAPAWADLAPPRGLYLRGFRDGDDATRVRLLADALRRFFDLRSH